MKEFKLDFYKPDNLKSYNLNDSMRYQLTMLDSLDVFTRTHSENVANITCRLCEYMHMKSYYTIYCTMCAYLHDIGKQFIPAKILQKNGPLTDEEYEVIKTHTTIGYDICMRDKNLKPYADGTIYHHESLNGTGYPKGISQKDIPLVGQIIRVADEFDAITHKRQYKSHIGVCDTLKILIEEVGKKSSPFTRKVGKINPRILKALFKVVIDDTEYERYNLSLYIDYLKGEINRLHQIENYETKAINATKDSDKEYYLNGADYLLTSGETLENYKQVLNEYNDAYNNKKIALDKLVQELKEIKKLKI